MAQFNLKHYFGHVYDIHVFWRILCDNAQIRFLLLKKPKHIGNSGNALRAFPATFGGELPKKLLYK